MTSVSKCPLCDSNNWNEHLRCKDFTVTHEIFTLKKCASCNFIVTSPRPDDAQLPKYYQSSDYISHSSKASSIIDRVYLLVRSFALQWKLNIVNKYSHTSKTILDYGCGTGNFLKTCQSAGWKIQGVEPTATARDKAIENTNESIVEDLSLLEKKKFGVITLWHVLEHVSDFSPLISNLASVLDDHGTVFIAVPNYESHDAKHYKEYWAGYDVPRHLWHFSRKNISDILSQNGFQIKEVVPMKLDAYYVSMLSEKYKSNGQINLLPFARAILAGLKSNITARKTGAYSSLIYIAKK